MNHSIGWVLLLMLSGVACSEDTLQAKPDGSGGTTPTTSSSGGSSHLGGGVATTGGMTGVSTTPAGGSTGTSTPTVQLPEANAPFDYQIGGAYTPPNGVEIISRDRNSDVANGLYNICYVNGFQTQPEEQAFWETEHPSLLLRDTSGEPVIDADWGELLLDISTEDNRVRLEAIIGEWISKCKSAGFDAVEIDNLDSYSRSNGLLTEDDNVAMMRRFADTAHAQGLAIGQKNSVELLGRQTEMQTDFAIAEECNRWSECADYKSVYGERVFVIEYREADFSAGCTNFPELSIVFRDLDVSPPSSNSYVFDGC